MNPKSVMSKSFVSKAKSKAGENKENEKEGERPDYDEKYPQPVTLLYPEELKRLNEIEQKIFKKKV